MVQKLRVFKASDFEGTRFDGLVHFVHDIFHTPFQSAIGTSFTAFVAAGFMVVMAVQTSDTINYMSNLAHY